MENKNILLTGATGGIGGAIAWLLLEHGYTVYAPVRSLKKAEEKFANFPNRHNLIIEECNVENIAEAKAYVGKLRAMGVFFMALFLAAGTLLYDHQFIKGDLSDEEKKELFKTLSSANRQIVEEESKKANYVANAATKENIILPYLEFYHGVTNATKLEQIGSQAAGFEEGHLWRFDEEGYCFSHGGTRAIDKEYGHFFKDSHVAEPALIDTPMTRIKFALNDDGTPRDWSKVMKTDEYALQLLTETGLI